MQRVRIRKNTPKSQPKVNITRNNTQVDNIKIQRAIEHPSQETLTPDIVLHLQAKYGNTFVKSLQQKALANQPSASRPQMIQRWQTATPSQTTAPSFSAIQSDDIAMIKKIKGLRKAKKSAKKPQKLTQAIMGGNQEQTREETPSEHGSLISENASTVGSAMKAGNFDGAMIGLQVLMGIFGSYIKLGTTVLKFVKGIIKTVKNFKSMKALRNTIKSLKSKVEAGTATATEEEVYGSAEYGHAKVKRRFITGIANTVIALGKAITAWVTFFTGGTTIVFTSIVKLLTSSASSIIKGYQAGKALYKEHKKIKGVARAKNAQTLIESAYQGQPDALQLLLKLKVGSKLFKKLKQQGKVSGNYPKTLQEMTMFLRKVPNNKFDKLRDDLKKKLSSVK